MASHAPLGTSQNARYRRSRRSELLIWWREIDRVLLTLVLLQLLQIAIASVIKWLLL